MTCPNQENRIHSGQDGELVKEGSDTRSFDELRKDFPILEQEIQGKPLVYLDSAASSQMPMSVINSYVDYHTKIHSNVHRGVHTLSQRATQAYEDARKKVANFIGVEDDNTCVFVRGATEGINLAAYAWGDDHVHEGDVILVSVLEHHANMIPWCRLAERTGAVIKPIPMNEKGELKLDVYRSYLEQGDVKMVAIGHVSNTLGTINPVEEMIALAHTHGALVMIDGCQAAPHLKLDMKALDADFYTFSAHKMYGPTGIGVLYAKREILESMGPFMTGGSMIDTVSFEHGITYAEVPERFEAGTPSIAAAVGFGAAADYVAGVGRERIAEHEHALLVAATEMLKSKPGSQIFGEAKHKASVISFGFEGMHAQDIGTLLDSCGVAVRTGRHCAEPVMDAMGIRGTARASFALYSNMDDVEAWSDALDFVIDMLS